MKAELLVRRRVALGDAVFAELVLWRLPVPAVGSLHSYKYRLALVSDGACVLRFDNERGKGDHRHIGNQQQAYTFVDVDTLVEDFRVEITRWMDEHGQS